MSKHPLLVIIRRALAQKRVKRARATRPICVDLLGISEEILSYGIGGLFTPLNLFLLCLTGFAKQIRLQ
jgi:hypothetical protein